MNETIWYLKEKILLPFRVLYVHVTIIFLWAIIKHSSILFILFTCFSHPFTFEDSILLLAAFFDFSGWPCAPPSHSYTDPYKCFQQNISHHIVAVWLSLNNWNNWTKSLNNKLFIIVAVCHTPRKWHFISGYLVFPKSLHITFLFNLFFHWCYWKEGNVGTVALEQGKITPTLCDSYLWIAMDIYWVFLIAQLYWTWILHKAHPYFISFFSEVLL